MVRVGGSFLTDPVPIRPEAWNEMRALYLSAAENMRAVGRDLEALIPLLEEIGWPASLVSACRAGSIEFRARAESMAAMGPIIDLTRLAHERRLAEKGQDKR